MNRSQVAGKVKGQICEFSGKLSKGLPKVVGRFVEEALYGILRKQSVRVSEVSRAPQFKQIEGTGSLRQRVTREAASPRFLGLCGHYLEETAQVQLIRGPTEPMSLAVKTGPGLDGK
jgi:hypothetical protein